MNKFQKAGLAVVVASSMAFAAGNLWGPSTGDFPSLQVYVPEVQPCWDANGGDSNACYEITGGWWYGYKYSGGTARVRKEGAFIPFIEGVGLTSMADGSSLIDPDGLYVELTAVSESGGTVYGGAGIGFNFAQENPSEDINSKGGYCITYKSDGPILFKLGHNESNFSPDCTFEVELPARSSPEVKQLAFSDFIMPGWCSTSPPTNGPVVDKASALGQAAGVKLATNATNSQTPTVINLTVYQLGWLNGGCDTNVPASTLKNAPIAGLKMVQNGRIFSLSMERAASVQVINLQGAVVYTQTITNQTINLSHLPTGVYMVRIPSLGYTNKVILK